MEFHKIEKCNPYQQ